MVPLAALMRNSAGVGTDAGGTGVGMGAGSTAAAAALAADVSAQTSRFVDYILEHQLPDGWLGPDDGFGGVGNTYWTAWNTVASLLQAGGRRGCVGCGCCGCMHALVACAR